MITFHYFGYLPSRFHTENDDILRVKKLIFDFKSGVKDAVYFTANILINSFRNTYGSEANKFCIVCAPTSSQTKYNKRFQLFSKVIASKLCTEDAAPHVHILGERKQKHNSPNHIVSEDNYNVTLDYDFFAGKKVIIFDDLITTGETANKFAEELKEAGAEVAGGLFLALTYKRGVSNASEFFANNFNCQYCNERVEKYINNIINK